MSNDKQFISIDELENNKLKWNLTGDLKLLGLLKNKSDNFLNEIQQNLSRFDDVTYQTNNAANKINNLITNLLILTNTKFIENRVYDEDIKDITLNRDQITKNVNQSSSTDDERKLVDRLENSINRAIEKLSSKYEIPKDDLNCENSYNFLHILYSQKNKFSQRNLPYLIGSDEFLKDTFVGLRIDENDGRIIDLQNSQDSFVDGFPKDQNIEPQYDNNDNNNSIFGDIPSIKPPVSHYDSDNGFDVVNDRVDLSPPRISVLPDSPSNNTNLPSNQPIKGFSLDVEDESDDEDIFTRPTIISNRSSMKDSVQDTSNEPFKSTYPNEEDETEDLFSPNIPIPKEQKKTFDNVPEEKPQPNPIPNSNLQKIFPDEDDSDEDDIFKSKKVASQIPISKMQNSNFFSSDDEEDDFFSKIIKPKEKPPVTSLSNNETEVKKIDPTPVVDSRSEIKNKIEKIHSKPGLSDMVNELNSVLKRKTLPEIEKTTETESNDGDIFEEKKPIGIKTEPSIPNESSQVPKSTIANDDDFTSMQKYKSKLNANRQRKLPTKFNKTSLPKLPSDLDLNAPDDLFETSGSIPIDKDSRSEPILVAKTNERIKPEPKPRLKVVEQKEINQEKIKKPEENVGKWDEKIEKPEEKITELNPNDNKKKSITLFDSSDSDDDIFKSATLKTKKSSNKTTSPIFSLSDSDEMDFKPFKSKSIEKEKSEMEKRLPQEVPNKINSNNNKNKTTVKGIFDDDSDDDLFKF